MNRRIFPSSVFWDKWCCFNWEISLILWKRSLLEMWMQMAIEFLMIWLKTTDHLFSLVYLYLLPCFSKWFFSTWSFQLLVKAIPISNKMKKLPFFLKGSRLWLKWIDKTSKADIRSRLETRKWGRSSMMSSIIKWRAIKTIW